MSIAVIGHGRSPEGRRWATKIDCCDVVIRMWDWHWQERPDYGNEYDYGVFAILPVSMKAFLAENQRQPMRGWLGYRRGVVTDQLPDNTEIIEQTWRDEALALGGKGGAGKLNLTRGCAAACWAIEKARPGERVILVGFDNAYAGCAAAIEDAFPPAYAEHYDRMHPQWRRGGWYKPGSTKAGTHDLAIERPLMEALAGRRGVRLMWGF